MRAVIQRVNSAAVEINEKKESEINKGLLVLLGICDEDNESDIKYLVEKIMHL
ncbi:MAG: D-aminoacyl-tRNA deacylase, partial [Senegalia sp. (in: firmicutes)]